MPKISRVVILSWKMESACSPSHWTTSRRTELLPMSRTAWYLWGIPGIDGGHKADLVIFEQA